MYTDDSGANVYLIDKYEVFSSGITTEWSQIENIIEPSHSPLYVFPRDDALEGGINGLISGTPLFVQVEKTDMVFGAVAITDWTKNDDDVTGTTMGISDRNTTMLVQMVYAETVCTIGVPTSVYDEIKDNHMSQGVLSRFHSN